jgi:type III secretion system FlhB-like substrate exporter
MVITPVEDIVHSSTLGIVHIPFTSIPSSKEIALVEKIIEINVIPRNIYKNFKSILSFIIKIQPY